MSCLSMGLREMILLVLLVRPTSRWREVGDSDTLTALLSRLNKIMIDFMKYRCLYSGSIYLYVA